MKDKTDKNNKSIFNKLTIVGGQPSRKNLPHFNNNLERLLFKAASDENLKKSLLNDRKSVIENPEFSLSPKDKIILRNISLSNLKDMIDRFSQQKTSRRSFLKNAAASMALLATGSLMVNCRNEKNYYYKNGPTGETTGIRPEEEIYPPISQDYAITPRGDTIYYDVPLRMKIDIPENAIDKSTDITIEWTTTIPDLDKKLENCQTHIFSPENFTFLKKITVHYLEYPQVQTVYYLNKDKWEEILVEQEDKHSFIRIKKFGVYSAVISKA